MASVRFTNPPEFLGLNIYRAAVSKHGGPSKANRFIAKINALPQKIKRRGQYSGVLKDLIYLCEAAEFPGRGFMNVDVRYYGPNFKSPFQTTYEDLNLTFLVRDSFLERQMFDDWLELINPTNTYDFNYRKDYICSIDLFQMSDVEESQTPVTNPNKKVAAQYKFTFEEAWPILVNPMPVNWAEDNFNRLTVAFTYKRWHRQYLDPNYLEAYNLVKNPALTFNDTWLKLPPGSGFGGSAGR